MELKLKQSILIMYFGKTRIFILKNLPIPGHAIPILDRTTELIPCTAAVFDWHSNELLFSSVNEMPSFSSLELM